MLKNNLNKDHFRNKTIIFEQEKGLMHIYVVF